MSNHKAPSGYGTQTRDLPGVRAGATVPTCVRIPLIALWPIRNQIVAFPREQWCLWPWLQDTLIFGAVLQWLPTTLELHLCYGPEICDSALDWGTGRARICQGCRAGQTSTCNCSSLRVWPGEQGVAHVLFISTSYAVELTMRPQLASNSKLP